MGLKVAVGNKDMKAVMCRQKFGVMSEDGTQIGTASLMNCTGLILYPNGEKSLPAALAHVEAQSGKDAYRQAVAAILGLMAKQMKRQDCARMTLVMLGNAAAASSDSVADDNKKLLELLTGLKLAEADIIDLRNGIKDRVGTGKADAEPKGTFGTCIFAPKLTTLYTFSIMVRPDEMASGATAFSIQDGEEGKVDAGR